MVKAILKLKCSTMMILALLLALSSAVHASKLDGAWRLTGYELQGQDVPASGVMIFADGYFAMVYTMKYQGWSGRGHGGRYRVSGNEITYTIPWWVQYVAGNLQVFKDEVEARGRIEQTGDTLVIRFASGSVQCFEKLPSKEGADDLAGAWLMDDYESPAKTGPATGLLIYSGDNFALMYTMEGENGKDGRAHAGSFQRDRQALTLSVRWSLQVVGGIGAVAESASSREINMMMGDNSLTMEFASGAIQKFHRAAKPGSSKSHPE